MMKHLCCLASIFLIASSLFSQSYMTAAGIRAGTDWGVTVQQRISKNMTIEAIAQSSLQREEVMLTALAERHHALLFRGLNLYTGAGLHKGWLADQQEGELLPTENKDPFGLTFIAGAEISLGRINLSYDFKPALNLVGGDKRFYTQSGVSVRYALLTNKDYKKMQKNKRKKQRQEKGGGIKLGDDWKVWKKG